MSSEPAAPHMLRFGLFELDLRAGELRKQGRNIKLQDQPLQMLELLLRRPGELVTREEVQQALWPADTFVEFDQGLNTAIKKIRLALGDSADNPRFVETIPRKGYRFIAPVEARQAESPAPAIVISRQPHLRWAIILFGLMAGGGVAGWWLHTNRTPEPQLVAVSLTSYPGYETTPTFSPDGNHVAFSWNRQIYVKLIGTDEPVRLTHDESASFSPAWSPDGRLIAFLRSLPDGRRGVFLIPAIGGAEHKVADVWLPLDAEAPSLAWHPSAKWLVIVDKDAPEQASALFSLSVDTGEKRRLTARPPGVFYGDVCPAISPDGRAVVFTRKVQDGTSDLFLVELAGDLRPKGQPRRLTFDNRYIGSPAWVPDGRAIVFNFGTPHSPTLYEIDVSQPDWRPGKPKRLAFAGEGARQPAISRQGRLAYTRSTIDANIWRLPLNNGLSAQPSRRQA